jgi:peptidoglycan/xylan/chitin deacetylase (PgdA/CDA1 family)
MPVKPSMHKNKASFRAVFARFFTHKAQPGTLPAVLSTFLAGIYLLGALTGCVPLASQASAGSPTPDFAQTEAFQKALDAATRAVPTQTPSVTPSPVPPTATPTVTPIRTPPALPGLFTTTTLDKNVLPQTYVKDTCEYLRNRWDPNKSAPGTVVMTIMYHSVTEDYNTLAPDGSQVHHKDVVMALEHAHEVGFEAITAQQLADFLDHNAFIPRRSLLIIVDDRKRKEFYETHFVHYLKEYGWTLTNAWISAKDTPEYLWKENQEVVAAGWVDPQAHGVVHNIPAGEYSDDEFLRGELVGSIEAIQKYYGKTPVAYIWPGGGFTRRSVELAREAGYRVGFTTNPRGPVMYNWIPQSDRVDPAHTHWLPEIPAGDPRMTLPRYWSSDAAYRIDDVAAIGEQAAEEAEKNRATELEYYDIVCKPKFGELPTPAP